MRAGRAGRHGWDDGANNGRAGEKDDAAGPHLPCAQKAAPGQRARGGWEEPLRKLRPRMLLRGRYTQKSISL